MAENNLSRYVNDFWETEILESICQYIRIPNKSPMFDPDWQQHGYMEEAVQHVVDWIAKHPIADLTCNVHRLPGRTPTLMVEIPGAVPAFSRLEAIGPGKVQPMSFAEIPDEIIQGFVVQGYFVPALLMWM